jgi:phosphoglucosamine mutase
MASNRKRQFFGTDGIRGVANRMPMRADVALKVGQAAGVYFRKQGNGTGKAVIGKDTRLSCYMIEAALTAGFVSVGMDVIKVDVTPTPAVALTTRSLRADVGVMISASHNPFYDNGIKLFDYNGHKLSDEVEHKIESVMQNEDMIALAGPSEFGKVRRLEDARGRYVEYVKQILPRGLSLKGMNVALDCANGAAYHVGPAILWELGADVQGSAVKPNGVNINDRCGSTYPDFIAARVAEQKADIGIALDGDADRLLVCDEEGRIATGDQIAAAIAVYMKEKGKLAKDAVVMTEMSNLGMEEYLEAQGIRVLRTDVGDRYVSEYMRKHGHNLGGEQSGHIILGDYSTTGDGMGAAVQLLAIMRERGCKASEILRCFTPYPQVLRNVPFRPETYCGDAVLYAIAEEENRRLNGKGRVMLRRSGTEPLIRVMAEGKNLAETEALADAVAARTSTREEAAA